MGERKLETFSEVDRRVFIYDHSGQGFALKFVSGPEGAASLPKAGDWLDRWEAVDGKRRFGFGKNPVVFTEMKGAEAVQSELKKAVDFVTEIVG